MEDQVDHRDHERRAYSANQELRLVPVNPVLDFSFFLGFLRVGEIYGLSWAGWVVGHGRRKPLELFSFFLLPSLLSLSQDMPRIDI